MFQGFRKIHLRRDLLQFDELSIAVCHKTLRGLYIMAIAQPFGAAEPMSNPNDLDLLMLPLIAK